MKNLFSIPYPRKTLGKYLLILTGIGLTVNFIILTFQPFRTDSFNHPHKFWILFGYGVSIVLAGSLYYIASFKVLRRDGSKNWNIVAEVTDLFASAILSIIATYVYYNWIFGGVWSLHGFLDFLLVASSVALIPVIISFFFLYFSWKDVLLSQVVDHKKSDGLDRITLITGQNKTDLVETKLRDLLYAKAQDNYVMLYIRENEKIQKHLIRSTLAKIHEQLDQDIILKTHRSYLVNRHHILKLVGNKSKAALEVAQINHSIPVSRSMFDQVKSYIKD